MIKCFTIVLATDQLCLFWNWYPLCHPLYWILAKLSNVPADSLKVQARDSLWWYQHISYLFSLAVLKENATFFVPRGWVIENLWVFLSLVLMWWDSTVPRPNVQTWGQSCLGLSSSATPCWANMGKCVNPPCFRFLTCTLMPITVPISEVREGAQ